MSTPSRLAVYVWMFRVIKVERHLVSMMWYFHLLCLKRSPLRMTTSPVTFPVVPVVLSVQSVHPFSYQTFRTILYIARSRLFPSYLYCFNMYFRWLHRRDSIEIIMEMKAIPSYDRKGSVLMYTCIFSNRTIRFIGM